jgi:hypothetical protein
MIAGFHTSMTAAQPVRSEHTSSHPLMPQYLPTWYPRGCLVAITDQRDQAAAVTAMLRASGFAEDAVCLVHADDLLALDGARRARHALVRLVASIRRFGDEDIILAEYVAAAERGHPLLVVRTPDLLSRHGARAVLTRYGVHTAHYYGRWVIRGV